MALLWCHSAAFTTQYINYCVVIVALLDCKSHYEGSMGLLMVIKSGFDAVKNHKNSFLILYN